MRNRLLLCGLRRSVRRREEYPLFIHLSFLFFPRFRLALRVLVYRKDTSSSKRSEMTIGVRTPSNVTKTTVSKRIAI